MSDDISTSPERASKPDETPRGFLARVFSIRLNEVLRLVLISVIVGLVLVAFQVDPAQLWVDFFGTLGEAIERIVEAVLGSADRAVQYFLMGAIIVLPIWLFMRLLGAFKRD